MNNTEPPPEVAVCIHDNCWCTHVGHLYTPICKGRYTDSVDFVTVSSEVKSILAHEGRGPVRVRWER